VAHVSSKEYLADYRSWRGHNRVIVTTITASWPDGDS
jgi:hypothetical protein